MLARITDRPETLCRIRAGFQILRGAAESQLPWVANDDDVSSADPCKLRLVRPGIPLDPNNRQLVRLFIRSLDDYVVRTRAERAPHLLSFYESADVTTAAEHEWVDPRAFFSAWAAGDSRSKYEVLDRGQKAAAMVAQLGDRLDERLALIARPASPYDPSRSLERLLRQTCKELTGIVSLPASSGAAAAVRHLATIGELALEEMDEHVFGDATARSPEDRSSSFGSVGSWRLPRLLTRIGEIAQNPDDAVAVWGERRSLQVVQHARKLLAKMLDVEMPNINRARSLVVEGYRYLDVDDHRLQKTMLARLEAARTMRLDPNTGEAVANPAFGEDGILSTREQAYTALVLCEKDRTLAPRVCQLLRREVGAGASRGPAKAVNAARAYAAGYIEFVHSHEQHRSPPLAAFLPAKLLDASKGKLGGLDLDAKGRDGVSVRDRLDQVKDWFALDGASPGSVREPAAAVWDALKSAADMDFDGTSLFPACWHARRQHEQRVRKSRTEADRALRSVPFHAREATRSLVAQAVLSIDGTTRREAVEALRQAGLADEAAGLFEIVVNYCRGARARGDNDRKGHLLDWLREQAVFCLSYTGSLISFQTLAREAGLSTGDAPNSLPRQQAPIDNWIRTTALLGLSDLGDILHDADDAGAGERVDWLVSRIGDRLLQMSHEKPPICETGKDKGRRENRLRYIEEGEERRSLVAVLAMLRSETEASVNLLHLLSGGYAEAKKAETRGGWWAGTNPPKRTASRRPSSEIVTYVDKPMNQEEWDKYMAKMCGVADTWDLASWQLAQWGLTRIYQRFRPSTESGGVRITDALTSSREAEERMRLITAQAEFDSTKTPSTKTPSKKPRQAPTPAEAKKVSVPQ